MSSRVKKNSRGLFGTKNCKQRNKKKNTGTRYERNSKNIGLGNRRKCGKWRLEHRNGNIGNMILVDSTYKN